MKSTEHAKVLIVEDEGIIANHLAARLLIAGYEVTGIAQSAEEALNHIQARAPEVILMDIQLKGVMDGIETTAALRARSDVPVIYLTAHSDQETIDRAKRTGASGFLTKPVQHSALGSAIEMALKNHAAERELRSHRAWIRTLLENTDDGVVVVDDHREIQYLNSAAEKLTGWRSEAARGLDVALVLPAETSAPGPHPGTPPQQTAGYRLPHALYAGANGSRNSGQRFHIDGGVALSLDGEQVVGAVIQFADADSRRDREAELRHDNKMRTVGRLAAGVAHDFNNLVFIILGYTDELLEKARLGVSESNALTKIRNAGANAATLADQLLTFSRKDSREKKQVNLNELIRGEEENLRRLAGPRVSLEFRFGQSLHPIWAQQGQLQQVLTNLVTNARDAMPEGGKITIETLHKLVSRTLVEGDLVDGDLVNGDAARSEPQQNAVQIRLADTGIGMTGETARRLFEPFFTTKGAGKGTGLGLAIVQNIIQDLNGTIRAESQPGRGSVFTVLIPCASAPLGLAGICHPIADPKMEPLNGTSPHREHAAEVRIDAGKQEKTTVLLIEDESGVRHLLRDYLADSGYRVLEAASGEEGLAIAAEHCGPIDLLITDVVMPNAGGFEIARTLAQTRPGIRTLFISGYAADFIEDEGNYIGEKFSPGSRFLLKPFVRTEFLSNVNELLGRAAVLHARAHS